MTMTLNFNKIHLDLLSFAFQYDITVDALSELRTTIERVYERTEKYTKNLGQDNADFVWDDTNRALDALRGAAFVICQAAVTAIVTRVMAIHEYVQSTGNAITSVPNDKAQLLAFKSPAIPSKTVSQIEGIEAFANYFKHHDQWPASWLNPDGFSKRTITALQALGFQYADGSILRDAITLFDSDLLVLANAVNVWHEAIVTDLRTELSSRGLL
jgi:hypothetical protein